MGVRIDQPRADKASAAINDLPAAVFFRDCRRFPHSDDASGGYRQSAVLDAFQAIQSWAVHSLDRSFTGDQFMRILKDKIDIFWNSHADSPGTMIGLIILDAQSVLIVCFHHTESATTERKMIQRLS
jgi:hypothetical protein